MVDALHGGRKAAALLGVRGAESGSIVLRCGAQQAEKAAAHRLFRPKTTALRNALDRQTSVREQTSRPFHPEPLDGACRCRSSRLGIMPAEATLAHAGLAGKNRK